MMIEFKFDDICGDLGILLDTFSNWRCNDAGMKITRAQGVKKGLKSKEVVVIVDVSQPIDMVDTQQNERLTEKENSDIRKAGNVTAGYIRPFSFKLMVCLAG